MLACSTSSSQELLISYHPSQSTNNQAGHRIHGCLTLHIHPVSSVLAGIVVFSDCFVGGLRFLGHCLQGTLAHRILQPTKISSPRLCKNSIDRLQLLSSQKKVSGDFIYPPAVTILRKDLHYVVSGCFGSGDCYPQLLTVASVGRIRPA